MSIKKKFIVLSCLSLFGIMACSVSQAISNAGERISEVVRGSGDVVEETRPVSDFDSINLGGIGQVIVDFGTREALRIEAEDNLIPYIETKVQEGTLKIGIQKNVDILPTKPIRIYVTTINLGSITVSGAGDIRIPTLEAETFNISIEGLGNTTIEDLTGDRLDVRINGSGNVSVDRGKVVDLTAVIEGLGNFDGGDLASQTADVEIRGAGNATVWVTESLNASISGLGNIAYYGNPDVSLDRGGLGEIKALGPK